MIHKQSRIANRVRMPAPMELELVNGIDSRDFAVSFGTSFAWFSCVQVFHSNQNLNQNITCQIVWLCVATAREHPFWRKTLRSSLIPDIPTAPR